jgi:hypothetical protein
LRHVGDEIRQPDSFARARQDISDKIDGLPQRARPFYSFDPRWLQHIKLKSSLLAAHGKLPKPTPSDAGRQGGETLDEGRGGEHPIVGVAADLQNAGGGVHRVADQRNLSPQGPKLADRNRATVQAGPEVGNDAKFALIGRALRSDPVEGGESERRNSQICRRRADRR